MKAGASLKYRRNKVKREHGIIQNALLWLENLGRLAEVVDIIPGVIDVTHSSERGIVYKYETQTGCKLLLKSNGSIQEVFVVTKNPTCVQAWVKQEFPPDVPATGPGVLTKSTLRSVPRKPLSSVPKESTQRFKKKTASSGQYHTKKHACEKGPKAFVGDQNSAKVANCLDRETLKSLSHLKKSLEYAKILNARTKRETFQEK